MRKLMEYKIISGNVVEIRRTYMNVRAGSPQKKPRGQRIAGNTSARKIRANEMEAVKSLARILNANLERGWLWVTAKYDDEHLPADYAALEENGGKFTRVLRAAFRREHGRNPRYVMVNANWSPERDAPARLHHHFVIEACSLDMLAGLWKWGTISVEEIDGREDHTALAVYMVKNVHGLERGKNKWSTSRGNLLKPIYTEPEEVSGGAEDIAVLPTARQTAFERLDDECGRAISSYVRCILPVRPKVRGGRIIIPRPPKRGGRRNT
mgnify:CR=1 FL=1|jgi:hypothetical protein